MKCLYKLMWHVALILILWPNAPLAAQDSTEHYPLNDEQHELVNPIVVLLHGLARSSSSMNKMQRALEIAGFRTCNIDYPSTEHNVATLASDHVLPAIEACIAGADTSVNFVTHSMGGILVRFLANQELVTNIGRVVMLSPPNKGSEVVDKLGDWWLLEKLNGPAGGELGTDSQSLPLVLGPAPFELGIITGSRSINLILSSMIEGQDDGKVSVERAILDGMNAFLVLPTSHPFIMKNDVAIRNTLSFLQHGVFLEPGR